MTLALYVELKEANEVDEIVWLEEIISNKDKQESWPDFTYRYFEPRFKNPEEHSIFRHGIMQSGLIEVKKELREKNKKEILGDLTRRLPN